MPSALRAALAALVLVVVLSAGFYALSRPADPVVDSNGVPPAVFPSTPLKPRQIVCDRLGRDLTGVDAIQLTLGAEGPNPKVKLSIPGFGSSTVSGYDDGVVNVPLPRRSRGKFASRVCLSTMAAGPLFVAGAAAQAGEGARIDQQPVPFTLSFRLVRFDPPRWSEQADDALNRIGYGRGALANGGTGWLVIFPFVAALLCTLVAGWRCIR